MRGGKKIDYQSKTMTFFTLVTLFALVSAREHRDDVPKDFAPNGDDCKTIDPLIWCQLRLSDASVTLDHLRVCADITIVDELQRALMVNDHNMMDVATPLRRALWRGFENNICTLRSIDLVVIGE